MEAEEVLKLFDSCWFDLKIFDQRRPSLSSSDQGNADTRFQVEEEEEEEEKRVSEPILSRSQTRHMRSMSDQLMISSSTTASFNHGSLSPDTVLVPKLQPILSGREIRDEESSSTETNARRADSPERAGKIDPVRRRMRRRRKKELSKSLSDLEFDELKGFMDLGFVFTEEDKDSSLSSIIPGLHRLGKKDEEQEQEQEHQNRVDESAVPRPYLSEAWEALDRRSEKQNPLMNWRVPARSSEIDIKDNLRSWAHTVASSFR